MSDTHRRGDKKRIRKRHRGPDAKLLAHVASNESMIMSYVHIYLVLVERKKEGTEERKRERKKERKKGRTEERTEERTDGRTDGKK
jgi:hypothetical protein